MKKIFFTIVAVSLLATHSYAQRFVYVDTEHILASVPEYTRAQKEIDDISNGWKAEIDKRYKEIDELYRAYQSEQVILPEATKIQKQKEIEDKEKAVKEYQKQKFGYEGELFKKKQELVKPIQDKIYNEIQKMSTEKAYDFVFDKSSGLSMLYASTKYDKSDDIIAAMGFKPVKVGPKDAAKDADKTTTPNPTNNPTVPKTASPSSTTPGTKTTTNPTTPTTKPADKKP